MARRLGTSIAYLGPPGTYGEQAAKRFAARLGGEIELVPCPTIKSIYTHPASYLVLPLENTLHGVVLDTVDSLLSCLSSSSSAPAPRIIADTSLRISHHLVARAGATLASITQVRSHEQALGQSAVWLDAHLPHARRVAWPSTAGALQSVLEEDDAGIAAICSRAAWEANADKLELLCEGTQGVKDNFTRFLLLTRAETQTLQADGTRATFYACEQPRAAGDLASSGVLLSTHQRPAPAGTVSDAFPRHMPRWTLVEVDEHEVDDSDRAGARFLGAVWTDEPGAKAETGVPESEELSNDAEKKFMSSGAL